MKTKHEQIETSEYQSVLDALGRLMDGVYRADTTQLREVFHPKASYATASGPELTQLSVDEYMKVVAERTSPEKRGDSPEYLVESLTFAGPSAASARLRSVMLGYHFTDFILLVKTDQTWRVIAKVFHGTMLNERN